MRIIVKAGDIRIATARHEVRRQARTLIRIEHQPRGVRAARRREVSHPGQQRNGKFQVRAQEVSYERDE